MVDLSNCREAFKRLLGRYQPLAEQALSQFAWNASDAPRRLLEAMGYSLNAGGKRLRPMLVFGGCEAVGGSPEAALPVAAAFEMIHTYSLIHDDLPAMDDDDLRRGKPTCHKAFDEATAVLAGDGMLTFAFETVVRSVSSPDRAVRVVLEMARGAGIEGMVGGQMADIENEGVEPDLTTLEYIHRRKTGALITAAVVCGGIVGGANDAQIERLGRYGRAVGHAFQVIDDILDVTATAEELGKSPGKDTAAGKVTYPSLMGLEAARRRAEELVEEAVAALEGLESAEALKTIAGYFVARTH